MGLKISQAIVILCLLRTLTCALSFLVITGEATPPELVKLLSGVYVKSWLPSTSQMHVLNASQFAQFDSVIMSTNAVIDVTYSSLDVQMIAEMCSLSEVPHLVLGYGSETGIYPWTFYMNLRYKDLADSLDAVISYFGWSKVNLLTDSREFSKAIRVLLTRQHARIYENVNFVLANQSNVEWTVGRDMRMRGNRISVFLTSPELTKMIATAQWEKKIGGAGFGNIMFLYDSLYSLDSYDSVPTLTTGTLILAEEELYSVQTTLEYYNLQLYNALSNFSNFTDNASIQQLLIQRYPSHVPTPQYRMINMQTGLRVSVGHVTNKAIVVTGPISFLGNVTEVPLNAKPSLPISGNFGVRSASSYSMSSLLYYYGATLALSHLQNRSDILENFSLELLNFTAGVQGWDYDFAYENVYPVRTQLGLAVLTGTSSTFTLQLIPFLSSLNYSGLIVGSSNTVNALSSREDYPMFIRTILADRYIVGVYLQMFKRFGWTKCGLFVSNETWGLGFQSAFAVLANASGISILNDPGLQVLPTPIPSIATLRNYTENFLDFIATKARVLIIVVNNNAVLVIDYLYELGLRAGDVQVIANEWLSMTLINTNDAEVNKQRSELLRGAVQFYPVSFVGPMGTRIYQDYVNRYRTQPPVYACFYYDSVLAVAYALDFVIRQGHDYTDPHILLKSIHEDTFQGCTGIVDFDPDTNDRSSMKYSILNAQVRSNDSVISTISVVGTYDPTSTVLFNFSTDIVWCSGTTNVPLEIRRSTIDCPFEDKYNQEFPEGWYILYGVCTVFSLLTLIPISLEWRYCKNRPLEVLTEKKEMNFLDLVLMISLGVDLLQYLSLGPDLGFLIRAAQVTEQSTTLNMQGVVYLKDGGFGFILLGVSLVVCLWVLMNIVVYFRIDDKLNWVSNCRILGTVSEFLLPLIGDLFFVPIISIFTDVYICVNGIGVTSSVLTFTDSYLSKDCYLACWQGTHFLYVTAASIGILVYVPAAVFLRPIWQEMHSELNIKSSPLFLVGKTVVQMALIILNKTVKERAPLIHGLIFLGVFGMYTMFCIRIRCFGYHRTALWHRLGLIAVVWSTICAVVQILSSSQQDLLFLTLTFAGWMVISVLGTFYQVLRLPSLLYRKQGIDPTRIFSFAFRRSTAEIVNALTDDFQRIRHGNVIVPLESHIETENDVAVTTREGGNRDSQATPEVEKTSISDCSRWRGIGRERTLESLQVE